MNVDLTSVREAGTTLRKQVKDSAMDDDLPLKLYEASN